RTHFFATCLPANRELHSLPTRRSSDLTTLGMDLGYATDLGSGTLRSFVAVDNLFDRRYAGSAVVNDANGRFYEPAAGRTFSVGVQWQWAADCVHAGPGGGALACYPEGPSSRLPPRIPSMHASARRALVTGASGDIGSAIAHALGAAGLSVIVHANSRLERAQSVADAIVAAGGQAAAVAFDVTDAAATRVALEALLVDGPIQIVVNNAGVHED